MSKESHVPFKAEYDDPNWTEVYTPGRHHGALLKANNSKDKTVKKYYGLTFSVLMVFGFTAYISDYPMDSKAASLQASNQYLSIAQSSPIYSQVGRINPSIALQQGEKHLTLESLDQFMSKAVNSGVASLEGDQNFIRSWSTDIVQSLEPGKIVYIPTNSNHKDAFFAAIVAKTPAEIYLWTAVLRDGDLIQLNKPDSESILSEEVSFADELNQFVHQGNFLSDLDDGQSFEQAVHVVSELIVSRRAIGNNLILSEKVPGGINAAINGIPELPNNDKLDNLNKNDKFPSVISSRDININDLSKEGLVDMKTKSGYGQLKVIEVNPETRLVLGVANHQGKASIFGGFLDKANGKWSFKALDFSDLRMRSGHFVLDGFEVVSPRDRYSDFKQIWDNANNNKEENTNN